MWYDRFDANYEQSSDSKSELAHKFRFDQAMLMMAHHKFIGNNFLDWNRRRLSIKK